MTSHGVCSIPLLLRMGKDFPTTSQYATVEGNDKRINWRSKHSSEVWDNFDQVAHQLLYDMNSTRDDVSWSLFHPPSPADGEGLSHNFDTWNNSLLGGFRHNMRPWRAMTRESTGGRNILRKFGIIYRRKAHKSFSDRGQPVGETQDLKSTGRLQTAELMCAGPSNRYEEHLDRLPCPSSDPIQSFNPDLNYRHQRIVPSTYRRKAHKSFSDRGQPVGETQDLKSTGRLF
jgi:hypothetical protein